MMMMIVIVIVEKGCSRSDAMVVHRDGAVKEESPNGDGKHCDADGGGDDDGRFFWKSQHSVKQRRTRSQMMKVVDR